MVNGRFPQFDQGSIVVEVVAGVLVFECMCRATLDIIEEATYKHNDVTSQSLFICDLTGLINLGGRMKPYTPPGSSKPART